MRQEGKNRTPIVTDLPGPGQASAIRRYGWPLVTAGLVGLFLLGTWPLVTGQAVPLWDAESLGVPSFVLVGDHVRAGRVPLWDPWSDAGTPLVGAGGFSPIMTTVAWVFGGGMTGFLVWWLIYWILGGLGMLVLCRRLKTPPWGGLTVAAGFLFCGFFTGHGEHTGFIIDFAAVPWVVWRLDKAVTEKRAWLAAIEAGAIWGLAGLNGYPGTTLVVAGIAACWALLRAAIPPERVCPSPGDAPSALPERLGWKQRARRLGTAVVCLALMAGTGLVVMSPFYGAFMKESRGYTDRGRPVTREDALSTNTLHPGTTLTFASPYLPWLNAANDNCFWTDTDISSASIYVGTAVVWMALAGLVLKPKDAFRWSIFALALLGLGCAMGQTLPLRGWLYDLLPPFRFFRHSSLLRSSYLFFVCVLGALTTRDLARWRAGAAVTGDLVRLAAAAAATTAVGLAMAAATLLRVHEKGPDFALACVHAVVCWSLPPVAVLLLWRGRTSSWIRAAFVPVLLLWAAGDLLLTAQLARGTVSTSHPGLVQQWAQLAAHQDHSLSLMDRGMYREPRYTIPPWVNNKHILLKIPVLAGYPPPMRNKFFASWVETPPLVAAVTGDRPVWYMPSKHVIEAPPSDEVFAAFRQRALQLGAFPLVTHRPEAMGAAEESFDAAQTAQAVAAIRSTQGAVPLKVALTEYGADTMTFRATCPEEGWLVVSDRWAPGWRATVNGQAAPVWGGLFVFRAVKVAAGENTIHFAYRPFGHPWLMILSWLTLAVVALAAVATWWRRGLQPCPS